MPNEANTGTRAYVPGKQVTVAHLIAHPAPEICEKAGIPDVDAIGILTLTPGETAIIAGDMAVRSADVNVAFLDRFSGTLILVRFRGRGGAGPHAGQRHAQPAAAIHHLPRHPALTPGSAGPAPVPE